MSEKHPKFLRLDEVRNRVPYSRSTIYAKIQRKEFPAPIDLGARAVAWLESDIDEWIAARIANGRTLSPVAPATGIGENRMGVRA
jgi:prophage regulatory protein